jgi:hypothetical protein
MRDKTIDLEDGELEPKRVEGGNLPAVIHDLDCPLDQDGQPPVVPGGPELETPKPNNGGRR